MKTFVGIDLGSTTTKAVLLDENREVIGRGITNSRSNYSTAARVASEEARIDARFTLFRRELSAEAVNVVGYEFKLQQVFLNLFLNARDAMTSGGWLVISTRHDGGEVVAEVADTGNGIAPEHLARIYDPFFTTKPMGQGTGLGLSITYGIVREHEATIQCESTPGQGTKFELRFIASASPERDRSAVSADRASRRGS